MIVTILDTETSGLVDNHSVKIERQPEVIEFYSRTIDLSFKTIVREYETLIKPKKRIDDKIIQITGITNEMLENAPSFEIVSESIKKEIESSENIIAHNMSFDQEVINIEFERLNRSIVWPSLICTVEATIHFKGFRLGLQALHEHLFNEKFVDHHRAKPDVMALERICAELFRRGEL